MAWLVGSHLAWRFAAQVQFKAFLTDKIRRQQRDQQSSRYGRGPEDARPIRYVWFGLSPPRTNRAGVCQACVGVRM
jgi:hypothetical protein